jgi:hypothetical protein
MSDDSSTYYYYTFLPLMADLGIFKNEGEPEDINKLEDKFHEKFPYKFHNLEIKVEYESL